MFRLTIVFFFFPYFYFNLIKHRTASFIIVFFFFFFFFFFRKDFLWFGYHYYYNIIIILFTKILLLLLSSSEMQRMFLTVSNFPVRRTGSKKAFYFIHNDIPKLSPPKYFDNSKNKFYSATFFFVQYLEDTYNGNLEC